MTSLLSPAAPQVDGMSKAGFTQAVAFNANQRNCLYFCRKRGPMQASVCGRKRAQTSAEFNYVELSMPALTYAGIPANQERAPRSPRADAMFCKKGRRMDVYAGLFILLCTA